MDDALECALVGFVVEVLQQQQQQQQQRDLKQLATVHFSELEAGIDNGYGHSH